MSALTKVGAGIIIIAAASGGGYYYADLKANEAAQNAMTAFKTDLETSIPGSLVTYGNVSAKAFAQTATVGDFILRFGDDAKFSSGMVSLSLMNGELSSIALSDLLFSASLSERESIEGAVNRLQLSGLDIPKIRSMIDALIVSPDSLPNQIDQLTFDEIFVDGLSFAGFYKGEKRIELSPSQILLSGVKNSTLERFKVSGALNAERRILGRNATTYKVGNFEIDKLDISSIVRAAARDDETEILKGLTQGFGIDNVILNDFNFSDGVVNTKISEASINITSDRLANFNVSGFELQNPDDDVTGGVESAYIKTLDLKLLSPEILTPQGQAIAASSYAGISGIGIKNGFAESSKVDAKRLSVAEISLDGIETKDNFVTKAALKIDRFVLPIGFVEEADRGFARNIKQITGADEMVMSFGLGSDYKMDSGNYSANINLDVENFAGIELSTDLAGLPFDKVKSLAGETSLERQLQQLEGVVETLALSNINITYTDGVLADKILEESPPKEQLLAMLDQNLGMFLAAYPAERDQIYSAIAGFLEGRNSLSIKISSSTPVLFNNLEGAFMSGTLNQNLNLEASGS